MTVASSTDRATLLGNGTTTVFPLPFRFFANNEIQAWLVTNATGALTALTLGTHYTLVGAGLPEVNGNAASVLTMITAPTTLQSLFVQRVIPVTQATDIVNQGRFFPEIHEDVFDRLTMLIQQANGESKGAIRVAVGDPDPTRLAPAVSRGNLLLGFDSSGNPITVAPSSGSAAALAMDLANSTDPVKGAGQIARNDQIVNSITELRALLKTSASKFAFVNGYYAAGDGGGGQYYFDAADTTSADNGGSIIVAADGGRWKLVFKDRISVKQFGAKGDGISDDTSFINAAFAASDIGWITGGKETYIVTTCAVRSGQRLYSLKLKTKAGSTDFVSPIFIDGTVSSKSDIILWDVYVNGNRQNQTSIIAAAEDGGRHGFRILGNVTSIYLYRCTAEYCGADGFEFFSVTNMPTDAEYRMKDIYLVDCNADFNRRHGLSADSCFNFNITGGHMNSNGVDLDTISPLDSGMRGARFAGALFGRGFDFEDYGIGSAYRNVTISNFDASDNISGLLFHSSTSVLASGFSPRSNIKLINVSTSAFSSPSTNPALTFFNTTATVANPSFADVECVGCTLLGHIEITGVAGFTYGGKVSKTAGGGLYIVDSKRSSDVRIAAQGESADAILFDVFPYTFTGVAVSAGTTLDTTILEVIETYPILIIRVRGDVTTTGAVTLILDFTAAAGQFVRALSGQITLPSTGAPSASGYSETSTNVARFVAAISAAGTYKYSMLVRTS